MPTPSKKTRPVKTGRPAASAAPTDSTRTSSRSAKRRSPKEPQPDPELLEEERTEFLRAIDKYKRRTGKTFPNWTGVLEVIRSLGWVSPLRMAAAQKSQGQPRS